MFQFQGHVSVWFIGGYDLLQHFSWLVTPGLLLSIIHWRSSDLCLQHQSQWPRSESKRLITSNSVVTAARAKHKPFINKYFALVTHLQNINWSQFMLHIQKASHPWQSARDVISQLKSLIHLLWWINKKLHPSRFVWVKFGAHASLGLEMYRNV